MAWRKREACSSELEAPGVEEVHGGDRWLCVCANVCAMGVD